MDSHKDSALPQRLDVVELGRRRRWTEDEKLRIVMETLQSPRVVSATARRHGISRSLLMTWRRALKVERVGAEDPPAFVPAMIVSEAAQKPRLEGGMRPPQRSNGRMVIEVGRGRRVVVDGSVDADALARVLDALDRR
jgi:transposase